MDEKTMPRQHSQRKSIWVYIKLDGGGFASPTELDLRYALEDAVEENGIGESEGAGSGGGWMDFSFGVENMQDVETALAFLKNLLAQYKVPEEVVRINVVNRYDQICDDLPHFQPGDCLSYRFEDGEYGAALVLHRSTEGINQNETLIGILDYKGVGHPPAEIFEQRKWLIDKSDWRRGQPYLVWAGYCWSPDCDRLEVEVIHRIALNGNDTMSCQLGLYWEDIPEYIIRQMN
ncbi:MAG TPA: hypothetical protein VK003_06315 [Oceanobacillus sp.]|nr:hypothetical protein [Oceanobacillus sp.]